MMFMKRTVFLALLGSSLLFGCRTVNEQPPEPAESSTTALQSSDDFVVVPSRTNDVQFRIYTNASPYASHLFNTFEIEAYGEVLLKSPRGDKWQKWSSSTGSSPHNILVNGAGPELDSSNSMSLADSTAGPDWRYVALDANAAYRAQLKEYKRHILFVEPDLFVLYDHLVAKKPSDFRMLLHAPDETRLDPVWRDLRLDLPKAGFRIHSPARRKQPRNWECLESTTQKSFSDNTVTLQLGPTNKVAQLDLLTVFAIKHGGEKKELAFRLLESPNAIGARIHRDGLPTLVAFKTDTSGGQPTLTGFPFSGPVGVDIFKPKPKH